MVGILWIFEIYPGQSVDLTLQSRGWSVILSTASSPFAYFSSLFSNTPQSTHWATKLPCLRRKFVASKSRCNRGAKHKPDLCLMLMFLNHFSILITCTATLDLCECKKNNTGTNNKDNHAASTTDETSALNMTKVTDDRNDFSKFRPLM